jgi:Mg-chelatase subunit ChlD
MAVIAVTLSLILHAIVFYFFPQIRFGNLVSTTRTPKHEPITLSETRHETEQETAEAALLQAEDPNLAVDMPRRIEDFRTAVAGIDIAPPPVPGAELAGSDGNVAQPDSPESRPSWEPRQEILKIDSRIARDTVDSPSRRPIAGIERVAHAADVVLPVDRTAIGTTKVSRVASIGSLGIPTIGQKVVGGINAQSTGAVTGSHSPGTDGVIPDEPTSAITGIRKVENMLTVGLVAANVAGDRQFSYFKIDITRAGAQTLPQIPADIIFMQDSSASMTEKKLYFCREGLLAALAQMAPGDNFNVVSFSDKAVKCFPTWAPNTSDKRREAKAFIKSMTAKGETDIFESVRQMLSVEKRKGRPVIAHVVTDGRPTTGITDSTEIIEKFSQLNRGGVSVFTMGTVKTANTYLLDLLSYRNRGDSHVVTHGRWDIPDSMKSRIQGTSRPVMSDLRYIFSRNAPSEVYPIWTTSLYLDRPLVLYGRCPRGTKRLVFQIVGKGRDSTCDMIFELDLTNAARGNEEIREQWAWQKVYHLIGEHTRTRDRRLLLKLRSLAREYSIDIPYGLDR